MPKGFTYSDQWDKEIKRLERIVRKFEKEGFTFSSSPIPEKPKRVTHKALLSIQVITPKIVKTFASTTAPLRPEPQDKVNRSTRTAQYEGGSIIQAPSTPDTRLSPEELKRIRHAAAKKAAATRKAREALLPKEQREALRAKRAAQASTVFGKRTTQQLSQAAKKAAATRKAREALLPKEQREALRAKRVAQARKNFFPELSVPSTTARQAPILTNEQIMEALKRGRDTKPYAPRIEDVVSSTIESFLTLTGGESAPGESTYFEALYEIENISHQFRWNEQKEYHIRYANILRNLLEEAITREGYKACMKRIFENSARFQIDVQIILYASDQNLIEAHLASVAELFKGASLSVDEASDVSDISENLTDDE